MSADYSDEVRRRILSRVDRREFVGRADELRRIVAHPLRSNAAGLLLLLAPTAGVSELLRQAYDELFNQQERIIPIYFAVPHEEKTAVSTAIEFLNIFLVQYIARRRDEPALCQSSLTLNELLALAPPADYEWIAQLVESYNRERFSNDDTALVRWCLSAPQRVPAKHGRVFVMVDAVALADEPLKGPVLGAEIIRVFSRSNLPYLIAGLRRQLLSAAHTVQCDFESLEVLKLDKLSEEDGRLLVEHVASRQNIAFSDEVRDLLVQQFECSPFSITSFLYAASEFNVPLTTYLACEQLYVDELMGGRLGRYFSSLLEQIAPELAIRRAVIRKLYEPRDAENRKSTFVSWTRSLGLPSKELGRLLHALHVHEFITWDGSIIQGGGGPVVWKDYLQVRYRLEIADEPRALVVAETLMESLKRAPRTMARYYRRASAVGLREVLSRFDSQYVPSILLDYSGFSEKYKGVAPDEVVAALAADTELVRLPQVVHTASCAAFSAEAPQLCDEERCVVAHAFTDGIYSDAHQVVWLAAEIDSKLEIDVDLTRTWCAWLSSVAAEASFGATRIWLIAREGFTTRAFQLLKELGAYGSSRRQFELLTARLDELRGAGQEAKAAHEFEMVVPMGGDNELIVAHTVEEIARRLNFRPEAINQIKHAVVEAFINASEHSLSPDRKIYQRFRVEDDKLVITISSRGIVPVSVEARNGEMKAASSETQDASANRRGLGLSMIKTLMDEVEFERVDEGTSLRMTKYLRS